MLRLCSHCKKYRTQEEYGLCLTCSIKLEERKDSKYGLIAPKKLPEPTEAMPGTRAKIMVLAERVARGEKLHHPLDAGLPTDLSRHLASVIRRASYHATD